jgi:hypothetical protein
MKKFFTVLGVMLICSTAHAVTLKCSNFQGNFGYDSNGLIIADILEADCKTNSDSFYNLRIEGFGGTIRYDRDYLKISCPFVNDPRGDYLGVKVSASAIFGGGVGAYLGDGGICMLGGVSLGLGASGTLGMMSIR